MLQRIMDEIPQTLYIPYVPIQISALLKSSLGNAPTLYGHLVTTAVMSDHFAQALELRSEDRRMLVSAAFVHDLGKMFIPDTILQKPGALDAGERTIMRKHVEIGVQCFSGYPELERIARIVSQHHERMDGMGYPFAMDGNQIDPLARMLSIVDAFTAMTEDRPYQQACRTEEALRRIEHNAGTQFDQDLAQRFITCEPRLPDIDLWTVLVGDEAERAA